MHSSSALDKYMNYLKAFVTDVTSHDVRIIIENNHSFARAADIGKILTLRWFHKAIAEYDNDEKCMKDIETAGGTQSALFLTESFRASSCSHEAKWRDLSRNG